ncbi:MAG: hypothetical protein H6607_01020 [Flavobacteriales bacterium]|nr:hypothetical protein [Flavobacteriales bacterium]
MAKIVDKKKKNTTVSVNRSICFLITGVDTDELKNAANSIQNQAVLMVGKSANSLDEVLQKLAEMTEELVAVLNVAHVSDISKIAQAGRSAKASESTVYLPVSKNKPSFGQRIGRFFTKLVGLVENNGFESGIAIFERKTLIEKNILDQFVLSHTETQLANRAVLSGLSAKTVEYSGAEKAKIPYIKHILSACSARWNWFVTNPIKNLKSSNFSNGNSGIYRLSFVLIALIGLVMLPSLSFDYSATWDEHEDRDYFKEVINYFETGGEDTRCLDTTRKLHNHLVNYGPFVNLTCQFAEDYISPFDTYETRHIVLSLFAFLGLLFTGLTARKIGSWRTGVVALLLLLFTPTFWGHAANNQKDLPFMAFYIVSLFYIIRMAIEMPKIKVKTLVMTGLTMGILFSIRAGGMMVFAYLVMFLGIKFLAQLKNGKSFGSIGKYLFGGGLAIAIAYFIGIIFWPSALQAPFSHPFLVLKRQADFDLVHIYELFEGQRYYMKDFPWYYAPKLMAITLPIVVVMGLVWLIVTAITKFKNYKKWTMAMLVFAIVFPVAYIIYKDSALYNSWRHVLFVLPGLVVLAAVGWDTLLQFKNKIVRLASTAFLTVGILWVGIWMYKNHPYEYLYFNEFVGGVKGAYGNYEMDYWNQSPKEAIKWLLKHEDFKGERKIVRSNNEIFSMQYYADRYQENGKEIRELRRKIERIDDEIDRLNHYKKENLLTEAETKPQIEELQKERKPLAEQLNKLQPMFVDWSKDLEWNKKEWDYAIWTTRTLSPTMIKNGYFPPKGTIQTIEVDGVPIAAIVKRENHNLQIANDLLAKNQVDSAEKLVADYIQYDPAEPEGYRTMALVKLSQGKYGEVKTWAAKSIERCPEDFYSYMYMGRALYTDALTNQADGNPQQVLAEAESNFKKSLELKPNFSSAYAGLGDIAYARNDMFNALKNYQEAFNNGGANYQLAFRMGEVYFNQKKDQEAAGYMEYATRMNPNFAPPYNYLYQIYTRNNQPQVAMQFLEKYKQLSGM